MNVNSLLNGHSAGADLSRRDWADSSTPSPAGDTTAASTAVPTPLRGKTRAVFLPFRETTPTRRSSGSRSPARNRIPWDADGYSLPLTIDTKSSIPSPGNTRPAFSSESPTDGHPVSPNSPGHKYSNSRSSLSSSYTSSTTTSGSHSRISSLSTVSEFQPLTTLFTDSSLESNNINNINTSSITSSITTGNNRNNTQMSGPGDHKMGPDEGTSAASIKPELGDGEPSPRTLPHGQYHRYRALQSVDEQAAASEPAAATTVSGSRPATVDLDADERPDSPTERVIIRRAPSGTSSTASPVDLTWSRDNSPSSGHRRAVSAPDIPRDGGATQPSAAAPEQSSALVALPPATAVPAAPSAPAVPALVPLHSNAFYPFYLDQALINSAVPRLFATVQELMREIDINAPKVCKYMTNCTLTAPGEDANWRKAMSHVFGRNKNCTRSIPDNVWICLCRKHYQRARYRNNTEYNKRLCGLVETQILRVEAWSNENRRTNQMQNGVLVDWTLAVRKRELKRLEEGDSKKRPYDDLSLQGSSSAPVPQWLLERCRSGYSTREIQEIVARIGREMQGKNPSLTQVPDIEILPNITGENAKPKMKVRAKIPATTALSHRRAQSLGNAFARLGQHPHATPHGVGGPATFYQRASGYNQQNEDESRQNKRARLGAADASFTNANPEARFPPRTGDRTFPNVRPLHDYSTGASAGPLPAPRPSFNPEAARSNNNSYDDYRARAPHQRALSDAGNLPWSTMQFAPSASAGFPAPPPSGYAAYFPGVHNPGGGYSTSAAADPAYGRDYRHDGASSYTTAPANHPSGIPGYYPQQGYGGTQPYYTQPAQGGPPPAGAAKHMRHQSTPVGPARPMQQMMNSGQGPDFFNVAGSSVPVGPVGGYSQALYGQTAPAAASAAAAAGARQPYGGMQPPAATEGTNVPPTSVVVDDDYQSYPPRR